MLRCKKKKKRKKKKQKRSLPRGLLYDKEAYKMSYHCVGLIMNIWKPKKNKAGENKPIIGSEFYGLWNKH